METIYFKTIILTLLVLNAIIIVCLMAGAYASGLRILKLNTKVKANHALINFLEDEKLKHVRIIRFFAQMKLFHLRHLN